MKYVVAVKEMLMRMVIVDAVGPEDALRKAEEAHDYGKIELDDRDYYGYEVEPVRIACPGDLERYEEVEVNE